MAAARGLWRFLRPVVWRRGAAGWAAGGRGGLDRGEPGRRDRDRDREPDWEEEEEEGGEPEERLAREVTSTLRRQQKAIQLQRLRRQMEGPGGPPRTLTREAMEQIRHLLREFPEEWPVPRLAQGFGVSPDVIKRVLRSQFVPTAARSLRQDRKALSRAGMGGRLQPRAALPAAPALPVLAPLLASGREAGLRGDAAGMQEPEPTGGSACPVPGPVPERHPHAGPAARNEKLGAGRRPAGEGPGPAPPASRQPRPKQRASPPSGHEGPSPASPVVSERQSEDQQGRSRNARAEDFGDEVTETPRS